MPIHPSVAAELERLGIEYESMEIDPTLSDTARFCEAYGVPLDRSANAILVASRQPESHRVLCCLLATTRLDVNGTVRRRLGVRKASFAPAEETREITGQEIGGVTVFAMPEGVPIWIDSRVMEKDWVIVGAGRRDAKIRLDPRQLAGLDDYEVVEGLARD
ncbi:MAG: YbaK/EbsC family protein [Actinomycetes bacterium]|jgi:prolyl-tRNA editing enzyme YbaK/EbsC (Cys-tRNA(Pro) deacylase)